MHFGNNKEKKVVRIAQKIQNIYDIIAPFINNIKTHGIREAYDSARTAIYENTHIDIDNVPDSLTKEEKKMKPREAWAQQYQQPVTGEQAEPVSFEKIETGLNEFVEGISDDEKESGGFEPGDDN